MSGSSRLNFEIMGPAFSWDATVRLSKVGMGSIARYYTMPYLERLLIVSRDWVVNEWFYTVMLPNGNVVDKVFREAWLETA